MTGVQEAEVLIQIPVTGKKQLNHLFKAEDELAKAGVTFDTGFGYPNRDWEFDWSLKGAKVFFKKLKEVTNESIKI